MSVRNILTRGLTAVTGDEGDSDLIAIDIGGTMIMARVTKAATRELDLDGRIAGMGAGQGRVAAQPSSTAPPLFHRAPRCMMATMWSSGPSPNAALTAVVGRRAGLPHDPIAQIVGRQK